jgi:hypothetical protein
MYWIESPEIYLLGVEKKWPPLNWELFFIEELIEVAEIEGIILRERVRRKTGHRVHSFIHAVTNFLTDMSNAGLVLGHSRIFKIICTLINLCVVRYIFNILQKIN